MFMWKNFRVTLFISFCLSGSVIKNLPAKQKTQETWVQSLGQEDPVQKEMATHSSVLAWRATVMEPQRVRHDLGTKHQQQIQP